MSTDLSALTVVVTGGARGIGLATARQLAAAGARVAIGDRDADVAAEAAAGLGDRVLAAPLDVTAPDSWRAFLTMVAPLGPVDVLVNNAGIMPVGPVLDEPDAVTRAVIDVNLAGVIHGTKAVGPAMRERGRGHIVNVASAVGRLALPNGATYAASKFAVVGFSEATRAELAPLGIEVSLVMPTVVRTDLAAGVPQARFVRTIGPDDVAEVILATIRSPRAEVWVPRWTQQMTRLTQMLPRRAHDALARAFRADSVLTRADARARADYEQRVRALGSDRPESRGTPPRED